MPHTGNRISLSISEADQAEVVAAIKVLQDKLQAHLVELSAQERRELPKMGDKTLAFVSNALDYAEAHPTMCPPYLDVAEFGRDLAAVQLLRSLQHPLLQLSDALDSSLMLAGSEAYAAALVFYQSAKAAAKAKVAGAATVADDLSARLPARGPGNGSAPPKAAAAKAAD